MIRHADDHADLDGAEPEVQTVPETQAVRKTQAVPETQTAPETQADNRVDANASPRRGVAFDPSGRAAAVETAPSAKRQPAAHDSPSTHPASDHPAAPRRDSPGTPPAGPSRRRTRIDWSLWVSAGVLVLIAVAALWPGLLAPGNPLAIDPATGMQAPSFAHPMGTDESGRDVLTRVVHGTGASLTIGVVATAIGLGLGIIFGAAAALGPRWLDWIIARVLEVGFAFPGILLALLVITLWGPGVVTSTIAVGLSTAPGYARVVRGAMLGVRRSAYVEADIVLGRGRWHRLVHTILPNTLAPLFALATLGLGQAIVWASALAFLGLGEPPPSPEWGAMLSAGRTYLLTGAWWLTVAPGTAIVITAVAATLLGRALQRRTRAAGGAA